MTGSTPGPVHRSRIEVELDSTAAKVSGAAPVTGWHDLTWWPISHGAQRHWMPPRADETLEHVLEFRITHVGVLFQRPGPGGGGPPLGWSRPTGTGGTSPRQNRSGPARTVRRPGRVACHGDGTTWAGVLPRSWDHRSAGALCRSLLGLVRR